MQVRSLGQEDPLERGTATHSSILAWKMPWAEAGYSPLDDKESDMTELLMLSHKRWATKQGWSSWYSLEVIQGLQRCATLT